MKKWTVGKPDPHLSQKLADNCGLPRICADILISRGIDTRQKALVFFNETDDRPKTPLSDPFLIRDMKEAADVITGAAEEGKKICVYGDYDCDGIMAMVILYRYIECMGGDVFYYINDRTEGYGLCEAGVRKLAEEGAELIVTVDNGISSINEAALCKALGIELIITDHHQPGEVLPEASAVVNPHRADCLSPYKDLCGCGVVLKLAAAMDGGDYSCVLEQFSDLAALATLADCVPLTGENRFIVQTGLKYLENTENIGLYALLKAAAVKPPVTAERAAFALNPRINAAGRVASAMDAVRMFLSEEPEEAEALALELNALNAKRQGIQNAILKEIERNIKDDPSLLFEPILVFYGEGWHHGIIGIAAAKLAERFSKPVFILSDDENAVGTARGSARSAEGFGVYKALGACSDLLTRFGGHDGAGGFSLDISNIPAFRRRLREYADRLDETPVHSVNAVKIMPPEEINAETVRAIKLLEPFGERNPRPLFVLSPARVIGAYPLKDGLYTKLAVDYAGAQYYAVHFREKFEDFPFKTGELVDLLAYPEINEYNGAVSIQLYIADYRKHGASARKYMSAKAAYERYKRGGGVDKRLIERVVPERGELAEVYKALPKDKTVFCDAVFFTLDAEKINYCKFRLALDIFEELGLIEQNRFNDSARLRGAGRVNLDDSRILADLRGLRGILTGANM